MPSHARKVKQHAGDSPLFKEHGVEDKLAAMFNPIVVLPSGGYLVINPTEALVSIDVNSGKSTREQSVEKTALATNLEAAVEVARQARLRDLAGLLVIDFIDMDENRNNRAVERKMKEALKADRARIQVGRISSFGLMEMSRQRMRAGVLEGSSETCVHCNGSGMVRSVESRALHVLRQIDENAGQFTEGELTVHLPQDVAIYLLNNKRAQLHEIEARTGIAIAVEIDAELNAMEMSVTLPDNSEAGGVSRMEGDPAAVAEDNGNKRRRRRGGRNRRRGANAENGVDEGDNKNDGEDSHEFDADAEGVSVEAAEVTADDESGDDEDKPKRRRRRGRRGGRNRRRGKSAADDAENGDNSEGGSAADADADADADAETQVQEAKPAKIIIEVSRSDDDGEEDASEETSDDASDAVMAEDSTPEISEPEISEPETREPETREPESDELEIAADDAKGDEKKPQRSGWWRK
jgi:ribonuclease E